MDVAHSSTGWNRVYTLWHIPSSTLLLTTSLRDAVMQQVRCALGGGCQIDDLMLQVTGEGELIGMQHLGASIVDALRMDDGPCMENAEAS